jgi:hypothetical protein
MRRATAAVGTTKALSATGCGKDGSSHPTVKATNVATSSAHLLLRGLPRPRHPGDSNCDRPLQGHEGMELDNRQREAGSGGGEARSGRDLGGEGWSQWGDGQIRRRPAATTATGSERSTT